jgi:ABC-type glycerol-3-phosphate transport system substrate-binding protein
MNNQRIDPKYSLLKIFITLFVIASIIAGCGGAQPTTAPTEPPAQVEVETEAPEPVEAPTEAAPEVEEAATEEVTEGEGEAAETEAAAADKNYSPEIPEPEEPVVVSWATWVNTDIPFWQDTIAEFQSIHPNITIEIQSVPSEEMFDKLLTQIAAGNPPDTAYVSDWMTGALAQNEGLVSLDEYISKSTIIDIDDYVPAFLQPARFQEVQYGLPFAGETTGLFYRTDRFEEVGLDPTHPPETWAEFQEYAEKLTDRENAKYGFAVFATEAAYYFYPWLWQAGGDQLNPADPADVVWDSPEGQKAADFYANLAQYSPEDLLNATSWDGRVPFANGDIGMYMAGSWFAGTLLTEFPDATGSWATAPLPQDERCATTIAGDHLVIFEASEHPEAAFKWIEFLSSPEKMIGYTLGTPDQPGTLLPPRTSLLEDPSLYEGRDYMLGFKENMACAYVPEADQPRYFEVEELLTEYLGQAFYGAIDGKTAVIESAVEAESILQTPE